MHATLTPLIESPELHHTWPEARLHLLQSVRSLRLEAVAISEFACFGPLPTRARCRRKASVCCCFAGGDKAGEAGRWRGLRLAMKRGSLGYLSF